MGSEQGVHYCRNVKRLTARHLSTNLINSLSSIEGEQHPRDGLGVVVRGCCWKRTNETVV